MEPSCTYQTRHSWARRTAPRVLRVPLAPLVREERRHARASQYYFSTYRCTQTGGEVHRIRAADTVDLPNPSFLSPPTSQVGTCTVTLANIPGMVGRSGGAWPWSLSSLPPCEGSISLERSFPFCGYGPSSQTAGACSPLLHVQHMAMMLSLSHTKGPCLV